MRLDLCGVRGSTPAPGAAFTRVGGHTSCVAITADGDDVPTLVLDAGTGIRRVSDLLGGAAFRGTIALTHLHWDHVQGLPFFVAGDRDDAEVALVAPGQEDGTALDEVLGRAMGPPHFPIGPHQLRGTWSFTGLDEGSFAVGPLTVTAAEVPHKGGRTFGYRVTDTEGSLAYLPDHLPAGGGPARRAALDLVRGVDLLLHDAQFRAPEAELARAYGHATLDEAVELAVEAGVGELVLVHHAPTRTDDDLDATVTGGAQAAIPVTVAVEGARWHIRREPGGVADGTLPAAPNHSA